MKNMASIFTRLIRAKTGFRYAEANLKKWLDASPEEISQIQLKKLRLVWQDAITNVPYYHRLVNKRLAPEKIETFEQFFNEVPILRKEDVVKHSDLFVRTDRKPDKFSFTGGSTGEPMKIGVFNGENSPARPDVWMGRIVNGLSIDDKIFLIWGHASDLGAGVKAIFSKLQRRLKDELIGYKRVSAYNLSQDIAEIILNKMENFRPAVLIGYSCAIDAIVRANIKIGRNGRHIGLKFIVATAETLPYKDSAKIIEDFFGCRLTMEYGAHDFGLVAHTLPKNGYRVFWHNILAEIKRGENNSKNLLVTTLYKRYFPAIRYDTGDEVGNPEFGLNRQVLGFKDVLGRMNDTILLADGTQLHSFAVEDTVMFEPGVERFQVVLEDSGVTINLVGHPQMVDLDSIRKRMINISPLLAQANFRFVSDLVVTPAGKRRWVRDLRKQNFKADE